MWDQVLSMANYWFNPTGLTLYGVTSNQKTKIAVSPTDGSIYVAGRTLDSAGINTNGILYKFTSGGDLVWAIIVFGDTAGDCQLFGVYVDSSGNPHVIGQVVDATYAVAQIQKFDPDGNTVWGAKFGNAGNNSNGGIYVDSSGNVFAAATDSTGTLIIGKYNSSGTNQWYKKLTSSTSTNEAIDIATDASGSVYVMAWRINKPVVIKLNSTATFQTWAKTYEGTGTYPFNSGGMVLSTTDVLITFSAKDATDDTSIAAKISQLTGAVSADREFYYSGNNIDCGKGAVDTTNGAFYFMSQRGSADLVKITVSSWLVAWKRKIYPSFGSSQPAAVCLDANFDPVVAPGLKLSSASNDVFCVGKVPNDGTGTGTYGPITYDTANVVSDRAITLTETSHTYTIGTPANAESSGAASTSVVYSRSTKA